MAESRDEVVTSAPGFKAAGSSLGSSLLDGPNLHYCPGRGSIKTTAQFLIGLFTSSRQNITFT